MRFDQAKEDIAPFPKDPRELSLWSECAGVSSIRSKQGVFL